MKNTKYTIIRKLDMDILRSLCIVNDWYTRGNSDDYDSILRYADKIENISIDDLVYIATDIFNHSDTSKHYFYMILSKLLGGCYEYIDEH